MSRTERQLQELLGARAEPFMRVLERATDLALGGAGKFGHCVQEAERVEDVTLTEDERMRMVLACAKACMAIKDAEKVGA